ncbi:probable UDP-N-acetylglucosamine--peptide N-acetylglucosaminyltransferase SPINDLY isoform X2 [Actinidia eriantha]|uniref:probable UDP-N-acetylglucosamine--peptide N-acetylglucosaminyltransferase SPINDLY isoform X2 n=1 Tax=Actinidia eriantha TaxID=165200 RepID=UPI00258B8CD2|nr:probable UDP-N-acetylglucosamine--peptide N-acetylglucosaminyltransferase SPINDLY isoform X2 [Actinidia eriantha]
MTEPKTPKSELAVTETSAGEISKRPVPSKVVVLADLNVDPPESDGPDFAPVSAPDFSRSVNANNSQDKDTLMSKDADIAEGEDADQHGQGVSSSREEKVSSLKNGLVHVARKMPKNAHAHFILGLMYQRMGQAQKAVLAYEKAAEILRKSEEEIDRPDLLSLVQIHHAQCLLLGSSGDCNSERQLEPEELDEILSKLKESMKSDIRQASVWNTLGMILLKTGRLQNAISVLSSLLTIVPDNLDCLGNLGIAYLQSGNLELSAKCFQDLILKDQNHPAALVNYAAVLLCKYGSIVAGAGANAGDEASEDQVTTAAIVAKECLLAAAKMDPKTAHLWGNLSNAYYMTGDHKNSEKCLDKAAKLEPNCLATRYAVAVHRIRDAERSQNPTEQLSWAGNEMASILREGDSVLIEAPIAWAGLAMVHKAQHEIAAGFKIEQNELVEAEDRAIYSLKQAIAEDPDDAIQWHQLGLHSLCTQQFKKSQIYLKAALARMNKCSYAWSNLGISLQLSDSSQAEEVYKRALSLATAEQAHTIFSNLGNLYRQQKQYQCAKAMFTKSLELKPGYAPAFNNLGLVFVAEGRWEEAKYCFNRALQVDPLLDAAKSNMIKAMTMCRVSNSLSSCPLQD